MSSLWYLGLSCLEISKLSMFQEADDFFKDNEALLEDGSLAQSGNAHSSSMGRVKESIDEKRVSIESF